MADSNSSYENEYLWRGSPGLKQIHEIYMEGNDIAVVSTNQPTVGDDIPSGLTIGDMLSHRESQPSK